MIYRPISKGIALAKPGTVHISDEEGGNWSFLDSFLYIGGAILCLIFNYPSERNQGFNYDEMELPSDSKKMTHSQYT